MADTLFDENTGGRFGNTHIAMGFAIRDAYTGDLAGLSEEQWERLGFNKSAVHTDIVSTTDRTVTAVLQGRERARDLRGRQVRRLAFRPMGGSAAAGHR